MIATMLLCIGFLIGDIYATVFSVLSAIIGTVALIVAVRKWRRKD